MLMIISIIFGFCGDFDIYLRNELKIFRATQHDSDRAEKEATAMSAMMSRLGTAGVRMGNYGYKRSGGRVEPTARESRQNGRRHVMHI